MNEKFNKRLTEFLDSECNDFDLSYEFEFDEDLNLCNVEICRLNKSIDINFKYNDKEDDLSIELSEDSYYTIHEYEWSVKYFWMLVSCELFN